nr:glycosyltransferase [Microbacter margulisiae]
MSNNGRSWADDIVKKDDFILIVRSIEERAGIDLLIKLAEFSQVDGRTFVVAGKGPLLEYYQEQITQKGLQNIRMLGYVDDQLLLALYAQCALVMVTATYGEGFGMPIIEGYLFNKPVIASNCCAIPEIIISNDFLFDNRVEAMDCAIRFALTNRDNYDFRGYYEHRFSNELMMEAYKLLYNRALK